MTSFLAPASRSTWKTMRTGGVSVKELEGRTAATCLKKVPTLSTDMGLVSRQPSTLTTSWCSWCLWLSWWRALLRLSNMKGTVSPSSTLTQVFPSSPTSASLWPTLPCRPPSAATTRQWNTSAQPVWFLMAKGTKGVRRREVEGDLGTSASPSL